MLFRSLVAKAEGTRFREMVKALTDKGVAADVAAEQVGNILEAEKLQGLEGLQTLVQRSGGGKTVVPTVPVSN